MASLEAAFDVFLEHYVARKHGIGKFLHLLCRVKTTCRALQQSVAHFQALERHLPLCNLTWRLHSVDDDMVLAISRAYPNLTSISIPKGESGICRITHASMQIIATAYPQLESFRLYGGAPGVSGAVALARGCPQLKRLTWRVDDCSQLNVSVASLAMGLSHLTHVELSDSSLHKLSAGTMVALGLAYPGLQHLTVSGCHIEDDAFIHPWPSLLLLRIDHTAVRGYIPTGTFPKLRRLGCCHCHSLNSTAVLGLLSDLAAGLECLHLEGSCAVDDAFVRAMTSSVPGLCELSLGHDENDGRSRFLTEKGGSHLVRNLPELHTLIMRHTGTALGDAIVDEVAQPGSKLEVLQLGKASNEALDRARSRAKRWPTIHCVETNGSLQNRCIAIGDTDPK